MRKTTEGSDGTPIYTGEVSYDDEHGLLASFMERMGTESGKHVTAFTYDEINRCTKVDFTSPAQNSPTHNVTSELDGFSRVTKRSAKFTTGSKSVDTTYTYAAGANGGSTSSRVSGITVKKNNSTTLYTLTYTYTNAGLIASTTTGGSTISYTYDAIGQLIQVDDPTDTTAGTTGTTWKYTYDYGGNILTKKAYTLGTTTEATSAGITYTYGNSAWKDQLTAICVGGGTAKTISYDAVGNPLTDGTWTYTWQAGRQLKQMSKTGETVQFYYNDEGLRVRKTATTTGTTEYTLHGKQIVHMTNGTSALHFYYGSDGKPAFVRLGTSWYAYVYNLQGDVIALTDSSGTVVVAYSYDAWGKPLGVSGTLASSLGRLNPFRYRGYVWDEETGLYYLRSRYYRCGWGRFVNEDALINGSLYCYCKNNPETRFDADGVNDDSLLNNCVPNGSERECFFLTKAINGGNYIVPRGFRCLVLEKSNGVYRIGTYGAFWGEEQYWAYVELKVSSSTCTESLNYALFRDKDSIIKYRNDKEKVISLLSLIRSDNHSYQNFEESYYFQVKRFQQLFNYWIREGYITDRDLILEDGITGTQTKDAICFDLERFVPGFNGEKPRESFDFYQYLAY